MKLSKCDERALGRISSPCIRERVRTLWTRRPYFFANERYRRDAVMYTALSAVSTVADCVPILAVFFCILYFFGLQIPSPVFWYSVLFVPPIVAMLGCLCEICIYLRWDKMSDEALRALLVRRIGTRYIAPHRHTGYFVFAGKVLLAFIYLNALPYTFMLTLLCIASWITAWTMRYLLGTFLQSAVHTREATMARLCDVGNAL